MTRPLQPNIKSEHESDLVGELVRVLPEPIMISTTQLPTLNPFRSPSLCTLIYGMRCADSG